MIDSGSNANTEIYFEVRANAIHPRLHTEGFSLRPHRTFRKEASIEKLQLNTGSTELLSQTQTPLHKREGTKSKQRKCLQLDDHKDYKQLLVISKDYK